MKHYVAIIKDDSRALFEFPDKKSAMASYHTEMAYACNAGITTLGMVITENGNVIASEKHTAPPTPTPVEGGGEE